MRTPDVANTVSLGQLTGGEPRGSVAGGLGSEGVWRVSFGEFERVSVEARLFVFAGLPLQEVQVVFGARVTTRCDPRPVSHSQRTLCWFAPRFVPYLRERRADLGGGFA